MKAMKVTACVKAHKANEFYVKRIRGGYFAVIDGYDKSAASLEISEADAVRVAAELNEMRNKRVNN